MTTKLAVLIVEDDDALRQMLGMAFKSFGFEVHMAANGKEAVAAFRQEAIDLVLCDVQMPFVDGPQLLAVLKKIEPNVLCCFMSGNTGEYTYADLLARGAVAVVEKPFHLDELRQLMNRIVREHRDVGRGKKRLESGAKDKRSYSRYKAKPDVQATWINGNRNKHLRPELLDLSEAGVRLRVKAPVTIGQHVRFSLQTPAISSPIACEGEVSWAAKTGETDFSIGVQLMSHMKSEEVGQLTWK